MNKNKKIVIYSHDTEKTTGIDDELVLFLRKNNIKNILDIKFPFIYSSDGKIKVIKFKNGKNVIIKSKIGFYKPEILSFLKDFIWGLIFGIRNLKGYDLFIGMNNLLTLIGIILRKMKLVKKVVYYIIDYTPIRFKNKIINKIYYFFDKVCLYYSDCIVSLNEEMLFGRIEDNKLNKEKIKYKIIPFGNRSMNFRKGDYKNDSQSLVYFGGISRNKGSELFVPIAKSLLNMGINSFVFTVIGGGDYKENLINEIKKNNLSNYFKILGRIEDQSDIDKILLNCGIAIAPYYPYDKNNFSYYSDPGKVKIYLGCGLPIVITEVPPISKIINNESAGIIASYNADDFANKIFLIMKKYEKYNKNAIKLGKTYAWDIILDKLFNELHV